MEQHSFNRTLNPTITWACIIFLVAVIVYPLSIGGRESTISWDDCLKQMEQWYESEEAIRIADNLCLYQRNAGGWPKNTDFARPLNTTDQEKLLRKKSDKRSCTIDNGATYTPMRYLAKVYNQTEDEKYKKHFLDGFDFLLDNQYKNGGWPQYPYGSGYSLHITFNDNAMIGVMKLLRDIVMEEPPFQFIDANRQQQARKAIDKGIECILTCQVVVDGKPTAWCAQHDENTLKPAPARSYEKISLSGSESVGIILFLMEIAKPSVEVIKAVDSAVKWFNKVKIEGIKVVRKPAPDTPKGYDKHVVQDPNASPIWARFYQIGTNKPIFCGRDGIIKDKLSEIEYERRNGYSWYTHSPERLFDKYEQWRRKWIMR